MIEKKLDIKGFTSLNGNGARPFTINNLVFAQEGGGKSRFIATATDPIGGIILDPKSEISIRREAEISGKQIILPDPEFTREILYDKTLTELRVLARDKDKYMEHYRNRVDRIIDLLSALVASKYIRTIFIDPFYQFAAELKMAHQGPKQKFKATDSGKVFQDNDSYYQECIKILNRINVKHTILTFKHKDEYFGDNKTGRQTWDHGGFKHIGNHTNCAIELIRNPKPKPSKNDWRYKLNVRNCLHNPTLEGPDGQAEETGLVDEAIGMENLARAIFPDVEEDVFERNFL